MQALELNDKIFYPDDETAAMTFVVDCMLGKLAKWLKILGFDAVYSSRAGDDELLRLAQKEGRALLTRDTGLAAKARGLKCLLLRSQRWQDQVSEVLDDFNLRGEVVPFSRCLACNAGLKPIPKTSAKNLVAPFVYEYAGGFSICPSCGRVYWPGTHFHDMESRLKDIIGEKDTGKKGAL